MTLPPDDPQRRELNDEVHARPPGALDCPTRVSYLALRIDPADQARETALLAELARQHNQPEPQSSDTHYTADMGSFRLRWERHTEFTRYMIVATATQTDPFAAPAISLLDDAWLAQLPGHTMNAVHLALVAGNFVSGQEGLLAERYFSNNILIGAQVAGGSGAAFTDWRIRPDGFSRMLVYNGSMTALQAGRIVQRLLEIDTYRVMALLALPVARELAPFLLRSESELAEVTNTLINATDPDEPRLLQRLMGLQAELENRESLNNFRFGAAAAYHDVVQRRIAELRERRLEGLQTFKEFTERRLVPAMNTCAAVARRQDSLSQRMARATQLLSTRVDIGRAQGNQALLRSMDRRSALQIRLQQTVEGLSVAAITYYVVSLVKYAAETLAKYVPGVDSAVVTTLSIPLVGLTVWLLIRRVRRFVERDGED
ncbi:MAG: DUF3422 domain-containing protein [Gammaproteobacteria bacterium]|jgi:uncharacterized membrane-anchored protein|nr:DUF3422 domain-containing protein [Gammaproteobacteria bacterium]